MNSIQLAPPRTRSRGWCLTYNFGHDVTISPAEVKEELRDQFLTAKFGILAHEKAPTTGQNHIQGYVYFKNAVVRPKLPHPFKAIHWETAKGNAEQNIEYCSKEDPNPLMWGEPPKDSKKAGKEVWTDALDAARSGDLDAIPAKLYISHYATWHKIKSLEGEKPSTLDGQLDNEWHYGVAGVGKSRHVRAKFDNYYLKAKNKWWDGYANEETVIVDDWSPFTVGLTDLLKEWADRYAFQGEVKNGCCLIRPKRIIITSQYSIDQVWADQETRDALKRRFKTVHHNGLFGEGVLARPNLGLPGWSLDE